MNEPQTPLGRIAKDAARFGFDAYATDSPTMDFDDTYGENGFSQEIQNESPAIMWDAIAEAILRDLMMHSFTIPVDPSENFATIVITKGDDQ